MVINNVCKVIGGEVVGALVEHLVVDNRAVYCYLATNQVVDLNFTVGLNEDANHILLASGYEAVDFLLGKSERVAHHATSFGIVLEIGDFLALGIELLGCVEGDVGLAVVEQLLDILAIDVATLALLVGAVITTLMHSLVNAYAKPLQGLVDIVLGARHEAVAVGVLDAQNHCAAILTSKEVVVECSSHAANVQRSSG